MPIRIKLIIAVIVFLVFLVSNIQKFRNSDRNRNAPQKPRPPRNLPGKKYSWAWMQAAGSLKLKFIRPEESNGWPAIRGSVNRIGVSIQCLPPKDGSPVATLFSFQFQEPAAIGLLLMLARSKDELHAFARERESLRFRDYMPGRVIPDSFFLCSKPACFGRYFNDEHRDHLTRLSLIYPSVLLTDKKLSVRTDGVSTDPMGFQMQLRTLLSIAQDFNQFAWNCAHADEEIPPEPEPVQEKTSPEPPPAEDEKEEIPPEPEPVVADTPVPQETARLDLQLEQEPFLLTLWAKDMNSQRQKDLFAEHQGQEAEWTGTLKTSYSYSTDFVFGREGGIKTTFDLGEIKPDGSFLSFRVKAVVSLPKESAAQLNRASGRKFRFRGKLLKIEPIAKEIYLADGNLIGVES